jgi:Na+/phosphate symporter
MNQAEVLYSYKGIVNTEFINNILALMESKMDELEENQLVKRKVYHVMVECLQNLYHHIDQSESVSNEYFEDIPAKSAYFTIARENESFHIKTGNVIDTESAENIVNKLEKINQMDSISLKKHYQERLKSGELSTKGTAGLGFIDIARKTGNKLNYEMIPINERNHFFSLNVRIN